MGRCGTSLMMKMLYRAGIPVYCDPDSLGTGYESENIQSLPKNTAWWDEVEGKAIKLLDIHRWTPPAPQMPEEKYVIIWMHRNLTEQAKSQIKLASFFLQQHCDWSRPNVRAWKRKLETQTRVSEEIISRFSQSILAVPFEALIEYPEATCLDVAFYLKETGVIPEGMVQESAKKMYSAVLKRSSKCLHELLELNQIR
jgi:hypothetical protein